jgi:hypothetical protein
LPDGIFAFQKSQFGYISEDLIMENVVIFYGHVEYFTAMGNILRQFGTFFVVIWYIFHVLEYYICYEKSGDPAHD